MHLHQKERRHQVFEKQGRVILAIDGLQPDVGHEVLWVIREVISGEILVVRALLSSSQEDLASLLRSAKELLPEKVLVNRLKVRTRILGRGPLIRTFSPKMLG